MKKKYSNENQTPDEYVQHLFTAMVSKYFDYYICRYIKKLATRRSREIYLDDDELDELLLPDERDMSETTFSNSCELVDNTVLFDALKELKETEAKVLYLHAVDGYSFKEIAFQLGITLTNATTIYYRVTKKIREKVERKK